MRTTLLAAFALLLLGGTAFAQEAAPTDAGPPMAIGASVAVWVPTNDADDFADTSLGVRPHFSYRVMPFLAIVAAIDFVFVNEEDQVNDITYYSVAAGARLFKWRGDTISPYGELLLGWHKLDSENLEEDGVGFRLGGGILYPVGSNMLLNAGLSYSAVSLDAGFVDIDVNAFVLDVGLAFRL